MKLEYSKPTLTKREILSRVTAAAPGASNGSGNGSTNGIGNAPPINWAF